MQTFVSLVLLLLNVAVTAATNTYPVVLVHGFAGWGRDELLGFKYWGGIQGDLQEELEAQGYTVYTASIGPFSSNWDRACELYAQIKGGVTDYGAAHSTKYDHSRYGKNYTGLYPEWGEENSDGSIKKIHLVGHSMGGQTIRMLAQMLEKGTTGAPVEETTYTSPLFKGGHEWIHSITTISTPNQGTTLADGFSQIGDTIKDLLVSVINVVGIFGDSVDLIYDAQLDQWGITAKQDDETLQEYLDRVFSSSIFDSGFKDVSIWSLSVAGAKEESTWVETLSDIYYYSYATKDTYSTYNLKLQKISYPNILTMLLPLDVLSIFLGSRYAPDTLGLSTDWQPNDGAVNTISMSQDYVGDLVEFDGSSEIGKWNQMTQLAGLDHLAVTGVTLLYQVLGIYEAHMELLYSLPVGSSSSRRLVTANSTVTTKLNSAISSLNTATASIQSQEDLEVLCKDPINTYAENYCATMLNTTLVDDTIAAANATVEAATNTSINTDVSSTRRLRG
ncbi:putative lipase [Phytophthora cinnamomi]|uniref:putative lipase n=1 Tax=Phytophthora cinnamomi TaxID=4785 RepID=UPI0035599B1C|nr:putative lipase [Phytophthora cinnamomi]